MLKNIRTRKRGLIRIEPALSLILFVLSLRSNRIDAFINPPPSRILPSVQRVSRTVALKDTILQEDDNASSEGDVFDASVSRRKALQNMLITSAALTVPLAATAGKPEVDVSGQLFAPKSDMLSGGSDATRGIPLESKRMGATKLSPGQALQTVYETRFLAYLSRFLLVFDPAAHSWWNRQGFELTGGDSMDFADAKQRRKEQDARFAEFAESVEVGLADYFMGPYGSYASPQAAKAGLLATAPATSVKPKEQEPFWKQIFPKQERKPSNTAGKEMSANKQGVLNLYTLLKARYTSESAKRQLAILFTMISSPQLQPIAGIRSLLGESDNATISRLDIQLPKRSANEAESRTSSRRGGGYSLLNPPVVSIDAPPALGDEFRKAELKAVIQPTSRVLKINVIDGGKGYKSAPTVTVVQNGFKVQSKACAILDRSGSVESVIVLDPGYGYGGRAGNETPSVIIDPPAKARKGYSTKRDRSFRGAKAEAELEYEITGVDIINGGNGYVVSEPPEIQIRPPSEEPEWFVQEGVYDRKRFIEQLFEIETAAVSVSEMALFDGRVFKSTDFDFETLDDSAINSIKSNQLELLPTDVRPTLIDVFGDFLYRIPDLPAPSPPQGINISPRYRAVDPIFGAIGRVPVTKGALELSTSEYTRLALSGAVCTVVVRTALNPLELVKTKIQLENDKKLNSFIQSKMKDQAVDNAVTNSADNKELDEGDAKLGTLDLIKGLAEMRGPLALFQSADITFLASLVFGSFGFGATELFRRSFTMQFFAVSGSGGGEEIVLLAAAALATVVTAAAAAPFEVLRVKSMGLVEAKPWKDVLTVFLDDNRGGKRSEDSKFRPTDLLPLWGGFAPTVSRELPFAVTKFFVFDLLAKAFCELVNSQLGDNSIPVQVGIGSTGLLISAASGAVAGIAGAFVSHPADLILTLTSAAEKGNSGDDDKGDWRVVVKDLLAKDGGVLNLFVGLPARSLFFFLVIGLQFFLYDYVKNIFQVGSDDLSLVLDVFYAVRQGLIDMQ